MVSEAIHYSSVSSSIYQPEEEIAMTEFCNRLGSSSGIVSTTPETRQEAQLLMMLSHAPHEDLSNDPPPALTSDSSSGSSSRESHQFEFTCPSFSLENISSPNASSVFGTSPRHDIKPSQGLPAELLGRPLKVDDQDALRLSADAMARNVLQSFQKAMDWRVETWLEALSESLVKKEQDLQAKGNSEAILCLLSSPEAKLVRVLRGIRGQGREHPQVKVVHASTSFDLEQPFPLVESSTYLAGDEYDVECSLQMSCDVHLETPLGYSEIELKTPGALVGSFSDGELRAATVNLDMPILAAMMEQSARKVVRACVEQAIQSLPETKPSKQEDMYAIVPTGTTTPPKEDLPEESQENFCFQSPQGSESSLSEPYVVTPSNLFSSGSKSIYMPEDLDVPSPRCIYPSKLSRKRINSSPPPCTVKRQCSAAPMVSPMPGDDRNCYYEVQDDGPRLPMLVEAAHYVMGSP